MFHLKILYIKRQKAFSRQDAKAQRRSKQNVVSCAEREKSKFFLARKRLKYRPLSFFAPWRLGASILVLNIRFLKQKGFTVIRHR